MCSTRVITAISTFDSYSEPKVSLVWFEDVLQVSTKRGAIFLYLHFADRCRIVLFPAYQIDLRELQIDIALNPSVVWYNQQHDRRLIAIYVLLFGLHTSSWNEIECPNPHFFIVAFLFWNDFSVRFQQFYLYDSVSVKLPRYWWNEVILHNFIERSWKSIIRKNSKFWQFNGVKGAA